MSADSSFSLPDWLGIVETRAQHQLRETLQLIREHPVIIENCFVAKTVVSYATDNSVSQIAASHFDDQCQQRILDRISFRLLEDHRRRTAPDYAPYELGGEDSTQCWKDGFNEEIGARFSDYRWATTGFFNSEYPDGLACITLFAPRVHLGIKSVTAQHNASEDLVQAVLSKIAASLTDIMEVGHQTGSPYYSPPDLPDASEIARQAASRLMPALNKNEDVDFSYYLYNSFTSLALIEGLAGLTYEQKASTGAILFAREDAESLVDIGFADPISLTQDNSRLLRKLLQAALGRGLIFDGSNIIGISGDLSVLHQNEDSAREVIEFLGAHRFRLKRRDRVVFEVHGGIPRCVRRYSDLTELSNFLAQHLENVEIAKRVARRVLNLTSRLRGAILIFTSNANEEVARLVQSAIRVRPFSVDNIERVHRLTLVDGALLFDMDGTCHAFAVILDGTAVGENENPARGSRFNSALRYVDTQRKMGRRCVGFVFSDDGGLDMV